MTGSLVGTTAVVTGASRGIGHAVVEALARAGARVVGVSRSDVPDLPGIVTISADLSDPQAVARAAVAIERECDGPPDLLVNNAGAFMIAPIAETAPDQFDQLLALNLAVPFRLIRTFLPGLLARGRGHIVTIGSIADHVAFPGNGAYAASKFGLRGLHEVLRAEVVGTGVRATLVSPGAVATTLWDALDPATRATFPASGAMLDAGDVADAILYAVTRPRAVSIDEIRVSRA